MANNQESNIFSNNIFTDVINKNVNNIIDFFDNNNSKDKILDINDNLKDFNKKIAEFELQLKQIRSKHQNNQSSAKIDAKIKLRNLMTSYNDKLDHSLNNYFEDNFNFRPEKIRIIMHSNSDEKKEFISEITKQSKVLQEAVNCFKRIKEIVDNNQDIIEEKFTYHDNIRLDNLKGSFELYGAQANKTMSEYLSFKGSLIRFSYDLYDQKIVKNQNNTTEEAISKVPNNKNNLFNLDLENIFSITSQNKVNSNKSDVKNDINKEDAVNIAKKAALNAERETIYAHRKNEQLNKNIEDHNKQVDQVKAAILRANELAEQLKQAKEAEIKAREHAQEVERDIRKAQAKRQQEEAKKIAKEAEIRAEEAKKRAEEAKEKAKESNVKTDQSQKNENFESDSKSKQSKKESFLNSKAKNEDKKQDFAKKTQEKHSEPKKSFLSKIFNGSKELIGNISAKTKSNLKALGESLNKVASDFKDKILKKYNSFSFFKKSDNNSSSKKYENNHYENFDSQPEIDDKG